MKRTTRRTFIASAAATAMAQRMKAANTKSEQLLFVGTGTETGSKGIYAYHWDAVHGKPDSAGVAAEAQNPSFIALSPDNRLLFAVNEINQYQGAHSGAVSSYQIDATGAKLDLINTVASGGAGPCFVTTDQTGRALFVANYAGGSAASFEISPTGRLSAAVSEFHYTGHGPDADRQEAPHAHRATVSPDNRFVYINDLGLDQIHIYKLDPSTAQLSANDPANWEAKPGSGPRALRFHPSGKWAYCVNELTSTIDQLAWNSSNGALTLDQESRLEPESFKGIARASEIIFTRDGRFAYAANRDDNFLATFHVDLQTGKLSGLRRSSCGGKTPRHIALDPTEGWLLVANQNSDLIAVFRRDRKSGQLAADGQTFPIHSPQCLVFV